MYIYKIINKVNGKIYIGKAENSITERWSKHIRCAKNKVNRRLYDAMNHYGYENFTIEEVSKASSIDELNKLEKYYIKLFKSKNKKYGYNMTGGGDGGKMPLKSIRKAKETRLKNNGGQYHTEDALKKMADGIRKFYKKNPKRPAMSNEQKNKISISIKNKWKLDKDYRKRCIDNCCMRNKFGKKHHFFGKHHSKEAREKIKMAHLGKQTSTKQKEIAKNNWLAEKNPNFRSINYKKLVSLLRNKKSLYEISDYFGNITPQGVSYKIKVVFRVKSIKDIFKMVDENTFDSYLKNIVIDI